MITILLFFSVLFLSLFQGSNLIPTIYLAGDSTVKTYPDDQYMGSWGQYLNLYLDSKKIKVINCAEGGRSARTFINEGRLFPRDGCTFKFSQNDGKPISETIKPGDYLFLQFGHNDDDTVSLANSVDRCIPLGEPDQNGIFPIIPGYKIKTTELPKEYIEQHTQEEQNNMLNMIKRYGKDYYTYAGTFKWFLKQYIDLARDKGAIPVLVTPVSRAYFDNKGKIRYDGGNFGNTHAVAMRQLAKEEDCLLIENFLNTVKLLETVTRNFAGYIMSIVPSNSTGVWPTGFDKTINNKDAGFISSDYTHYNKFGGFLTAGLVIEDILKKEEEIHINNEKFGFIDGIKSKPTNSIVPSTLIPGEIIKKIYALYTKVDPR